MNWGTKLTLGMILFMGFIITLVILMIKPHKADSLIEADYYEKGQSFDRDYDAVQNANLDSIVPMIRVDNSGISITFRAAVTYKILLRSLADASMDKTIYGSQAKKEIQISSNELSRGSWLLRVDYYVGQRSYLYQNKILIP